VRAASFIPSTEWTMRDRSRRCATKALAELGLNAAKPICREQRALIRAVHADGGVRWRNPAGNLPHSQGSRHAGFDKDLEWAGWKGMVFIPSCLFYGDGKALAAGVFAGRADALKAFRVSARRRGVAEIAGVDGNRRSFAGKRSKSTMFRDKPH